MIRFTKSNAWLIVDRMEFVEHVVADVDLLIVRTTSLADPIVGPCNMTRFAFPRNGVYATSLNTGSTTGSCPATETDTGICEAQTYPGNLCIWELRRETGISQKIMRVQDYDSAELSMATTCPAQPTFGGCNANSLRQQTAFWTTEQMRSFMQSYVWFYTSPTQAGPVAPWVDWPRTNCAYYAWGAYSSIECAAAESKAHVFMHEYGHHVVWTYGDVGNQCVPNVGAGNLYESDAIDETYANVFAALFAAADSAPGGIRPQYGAVAGLAYQAPSPHTNAGSIVSGYGRCGSVDFHNIGRAFEQAMWELMWNRNCSSVACTTTSAFGSAIFPSATQTQVLVSMGTALGYSLSVSGMEPKFQSLWTHMYVKLIGLHGVTEANNANDVMTHHVIGL